MAVRASKDLVDELVHQFTDPYAFYRELIQNSIDAGSNRIEVQLAYHPTAKQPMVTATVADWGEGMTRKIIEDFLLTKFRSSKEDDATKIGKYGIGFVSIFACQPDAVTVDTGRDGEFWRVLFKADRTHQLIRIDGPLDGTRITVHKFMAPKQYDEFSQKSAEAVKKWCRHSEVDVALTIGPADGTPPPPAQSVREPLSVDAPFQVEHQEDGLKLVVGVSRQPQPTLGLYNRGLTLLETQEELIPGVSIKAIASRLEHTLTRDNVRRDQNFAKVVKRAQAMVDGPLKDRLPDELRRTAQDPLLRDDWRTLFGYAQSRLKPAQLWLRRPEGGAIDGTRLLKHSPLRWLWLAEKRTPIVDRLDAAGVPVIELLPNDGLGGVVRERFGLVDSAMAEQVWTHAEPTSGDPAPAFTAALSEALRLLKATSKSVALTRLHGAAAELPFVLVDDLGKPLMLATAAGSPFARKAPGTLVLNQGHADIARLGPLLASAPRLAAMLVARRVAAHFSALDASRDRALTGWGLA
jgi:molecular chaperone HtpG